MTFHTPELLWLLCALPVLAVLRARRGPRAAITYSSIEVAREVAHSTKSRPLGWPSALRWLAAAAFIVALARPQLNHTQTRVEASGTDLVLAVDVSTSMEALDMTADGQPSSRLAAVKPVIQKFIEDRPNDRIGLVAFSGAPYLVSPPTLDHGWLLRNLERLQTGMVQDGTAIGSAITSGVNRLRQGDAKSKTMVLLTDGVSNAGKVQPTLAAQAAAAEGVKVYTIGVGSEGRALMPLADEQGRRRMVMTDVDVDEPTLRKIADTTGGRFFRATDTASLERVYADIDAMEKTKRTSESQVTHQEEFQWPALAGLGLLGLELLSGIAFGRRLPC
jgi:Ca-activated chloride channel family protein